jgi:hypothetical protein
MVYVVADFIPVLTSRLANPAVTVVDITIYIESAMREVKPDNYAPSDYFEQVLDTACYKLSIDNKFPEVQTVSQNGLSTSFSSNDPERFRRRITERRQASVMRFEE